MIEIKRSVYSYEGSISSKLTSLSSRVREMRKGGKLSPSVLYKIRRYFRIKNIYHSNAIEGNILEVGETRQVVEKGLTITGRPLKDQAEARNLSGALDYLEELAGDVARPIREQDIRQIHEFVLRGIHEEAGSYRTVPVEIGGSEYVPPGPETVPAEMREFGEYLADVSIPDDVEIGSEEGLLAAAVAHTQFVTTHPFIDGNGRVARLLLNLILMRYGYPIAIITKEDRLRYYDALETSQASDLTPFIALLVECLEESLDEYELAAKEQREQVEWAQSLAQKFTEKEQRKARNEYEAWVSAMDLLKTHFRDAADSISEALTIGSSSLQLREFDPLEFEKYLALSRGESAKRTWFFRVDLRNSEGTARYLFFFGRTNRQLASDGKFAQKTVTLTVAREEPMNSFNYERIDTYSVGKAPSLAEIGYDAPRERFVARHPQGGITKNMRAEQLAQKFFTEVVDYHS